MRMDSGFNCIRVKKAQLLETLEKNREIHRETYEEAIENWGWRQSFVTNTVSYAGVDKQAQYAMKA
jgi:hypothetical protein